MKKTNDAIMYLGAHYPNWRPNEMTPLAWSDVLGEETSNDIAAACREYASKAHEFPPSPGQILKIIQANKPLPQPTAEELEYMNAELPAGDDGGRLRQAALKARYGTNGVQPTTETRKKLEPARERTGPLRARPFDALPPREEP